MIKPHIWDVIKGETYRIIIIIVIKLENIITNILENIDGEPLDFNA